MITIEELVADGQDAITSASLLWQDETLDLVRQAPEGQTAYDILLAELSKAQKPVPHQQEDETDEENFSR